MNAPTAIAVAMQIHLACIVQLAKPFTKITTHVPANTITTRTADRAMTQKIHTHNMLQTMLAPPQSIHFPMTQITLKIVTPANATVNHEAGLLTLVLDRALQLPIDLKQMLTPVQSFLI